MRHWKTQPRTIYTFIYDYTESSMGGELSMDSEIEENLSEMAYHALRRVYPEARGKSMHFEVMQICSPDEPESIVHVSVPLITNQ